MANSWSTSGLCRLRRHGLVSLITLVVVAAGCVPGPGSTTTLPTNTQYLPEGTGMYGASSSTAGWRYNADGTTTDLTFQQAFDAFRNNPRFTFNYYDGVVTDEFGSIVYSGPPNGLYGALSPDSKRFVVGLLDVGGQTHGVLTVYNTEGWTPVRTIPAGQVGRINWSPDSQQFTEGLDTSTTPATQAVFGTDDLALDRVVAVDVPQPWVLGWSAAGRFAVRSGDADLYTLSAIDGTDVHHIATQSSDPSLLFVDPEFSPSGRYIALYVDLNGSPTPQLVYAPDEDEPTLVPFIGLPSMFLRWV